MEGQGNLTTMFYDLAILLRGLMRLILVKKERNPSNDV